MITFLDARITSDRTSYSLEVETDVQENIKENGKLIKTGKIVKRWKMISLSTSTIENCILSYIRYKGLEIADNEDITLTELIDRLTAIKDEIKSLIKGI
jgi:GH43 family beta-xylosidase